MSYISGRIHLYASMDTQTNLTALKVLHITDCHLIENREGDLLGMKTHASLMAVLAQVRADQRNPDLILVTGDIAQDGSIAAYQALKESLSGYSCPIAWFPGNHDNRENMQQVGAAPGFLEKVKRYERWQVVLLDSLDSGQVSGKLDQVELDTLDRALQESEKHTLVCLHHHPVSVGSGWIDNIGLRNSEEFWQTLAGKSHLQGVLWGHIHQVYDEEKEGVRLLASPSTCIQFKPNSEGFALDDLAPGYRWLELHADGRIETEVVRAESFEYQLDMQSRGY